MDPTTRNRPRHTRPVSQRLPDGGTSSPEGPVAIVTGASSGIGRACAVRLGSVGYRVGLIARRAELLEAVAAEIAAAGGTAVSAVADVGDRGQLREAVAAIERQLGPAGVMVANAGFGAPRTSTRSTSTTSSRPSA